MRVRLRAKGQRLWRRHRGIFFGVLAAVGALVLLGWLVLYVLPPTLVSDEATDQAKAESDARTTLIQAAAGLMRTRATGSTSRGAHLEGAILVDAHLEGVRFVRAHLEGAYFASADLKGPNSVTPT